MLVAGAGCGFEHGALDGDDPGVDAAVPLPDPTPDGGGSSTAARTCRYPDSNSLRLCLEFDDGVLSPVHDGSSAQLDAMASGLTATMRVPNPPDPAVTVAEGASIAIAETSALDITGPITIEAWVRPAEYQDVAIVSNETQYALGVTDGGEAWCGMAGVSVTSYQASSAILTGQWHHIACTFDGTLVRVYVDGTSRDCRQRQAPNISTLGTRGTKIAPSFVGDIDGVRIYSRDLGSELCTHANRTGCQQSCQTYSGPGF